MKRALALALAITCSAATAHAADELQYEPWPHAPITTGIGMLLLGEVALRGELAPETCRHCASNAFDRSLTDALAWQNHDLATTFSDVGLVLMPTSALVYGFAEDGRDEGIIDGIVFLEAFAINFMATEAIKFAFARERPMVSYLGTDDPKLVGREEDWNVSFPSGHASAAFTSVAALAAIADLRGRDPTAIWLIGLPTAASIAYFRVAGLHHWTTDVLAGAALGTVIGAAVPRLLHGSGLGDDDNEGASPRPAALQIFQLGGAF